MPDHHRGSADTLTDVLADAGAICGNGVLVNEYGQTSLPGISALGDCAWHPNRYAASELTRLESVQNATDQAKTVASDIVGNPSPYAAVPWFSSDQYDAKLKTAGLAADDDLVVRPGDDPGSFTVVRLQAGQVTAVECINSPADFAIAKKLVEAGTIADPAVVADPEVTLRAIYEASRSSQFDALKPVLSIA